MQEWPDSEQSHYQFYTHHANIRLTHGHRNASGRCLPVVLIKASNSTSVLRSMPGAYIAAAEGTPLMLFFCFFLLCEKSVT